MIASREELAHNGGGGRADSAIAVEEVCTPTISLEHEHAFIVEAVISSGPGVDGDASSWHRSRAAMVSR